MKICSNWPVYVTFNADERKNHRLNINYTTR